VPDAANESTVDVAAHRAADHNDLDLEELHPGDERHGAS
jgi:hypothetical protein